MDTSGKQVQIPAFYMRGGTSKGVFFVPGDLPADKSVRDAVLMRVIGSPDPYGKQIDGLGAATSSTSKVVIVGPSSRDDCDVDYWFGQVAIGQPLVDWSGNCGNLTAAVGPFAIHRGLVQAPHDGVATVRIWQANLGKRIVARVPMREGQVQELGDFELDGVTFPAAEIPLTFVDPGADEEGGQGGMFPTGNTLDVLDVPGVGPIEVTMMNAGNPSVMINAASLGLSATEAQGDVNGNPALLAKLEAVRAHAAVAMGAARTVDEATNVRPNTPKLAFFGAPAAYTASSGKPVAAADIDIVARIMSMGQMHHAMTGTGAVAIAAAAAVPGTIVSRILGSARAGICFGHASGRLRVGAETEQRDGTWTVANVTLSRSARRLMVGTVFVPESALKSPAA
jgi:probable AcnD-accessory protein PrpF